MSAIKSAALLLLAALTVGVQRPAAAPDTQRERAKFNETAEGEASVDTKTGALTVKVVNVCGDEKNPREVVFVKPYEREDVERTCAATGQVKRLAYVRQKRFEIMMAALRPRR